MSSQPHTCLNKMELFERKNRMLIEMARTMLDEYKTLKHFWAEAIETACHTTNRLDLHKLLGKMAYELLDTSLAYL